MTVEPVLTLVVLALLANLAVMAVVLLPPALRHGRFAGRPVMGGRAAAPADPGEPIGNGRRQAPPTWDREPMTPAYDQVVRIVSWVFILATSTLIAVTGLWPEQQPIIFVLLALGGLFVLVVHDILPPAVLGQAKYVLEGCVAITFATLLVVFTGGDESPFFFVFPLIVAGAALGVPPRVTVAMATAATLGYLVAASTGSSGGFSPETVARVGVNLTALMLLAYVATVIAREQRRARDAAIRMSSLDALTGLFNRSFFFAAVEREIDRSTRSGRGFCLLMMDLDELKAINDRYGHFIGDRVLNDVGDIIRAGVRRIDTAARYGGDEFVVLLPETEASGAWVLAEKIRQGVAELLVPGTESRPSMSVGVVSYPDDGRTPDELMIAADQAMYASKRTGKNRVMGIPVTRDRTGVAG